MKIIELMGEIWQEGNMFTAYCHELDLASCGRTVEEARHLPQAGGKPLGFSWKRRPGKARLGLC